MTPDPRNEIAKLLADAFDYDTDAIEAVIDRILALTSETGIDSKRLDWLDTQAGFSSGPLIRAITGTEWKVILRHGHELPIPTIREAIDHAMNPK